jgi:hypothetical protein
MNVPWDALSAIATAIQALVVIIAAVVAVYQWQEALAARRLQGSEGTIEALLAPSLRSNLDFLQEHQEDLAKMALADDGMTKLKDLISKAGEDGPGNLANLRRDLAVLEFVSVLSFNQMIPPSLEQAYLAATLRRYWVDAMPLVRIMRKALGNDLYLQHFEALVELAGEDDFYNNRKAGKKKNAKRRQLIERSKFVARDLNVKMDLQV